MRRMNTTPSTPTTDDTEERKTADGTAVVPGPAKKAAPTEGDAVPEGVAPGVTASDVTAMDVAATDAAAEDGLEVELEPDAHADAEAAASAGTGAGAAAVVAAALGVVSLSGAWTGRVAAERETLIGQIKTSGGGGSAAQQISEIYGDAWHSTALVNGVFALLALLVGVFVLVRPAFGTPSVHPQAGWIRSVAWAGIALGVLGVLISVGMYLDLFVAMPSAAAGS
ncbi:hypothetical protein [Streptomyces sp. NPDC006289]|uniref:hypothetical protein n=1 Tax=Streptomyces sp. NPDC006289 TaxID=3156744 RepID=UPI0033AB718D